MFYFIFFVGWLVKIFFNKTITNKKQNLLTRTENRKKNESEKDESEETFHWEKFPDHLGHLLLTFFIYKQ